MTTLTPGKLIFRLDNKNETMTIVGPQSWAVGEGWFLAQYEYTGLYRFIRLTGRTRKVWGKDCPTIERYAVETVVRHNKDGLPVIMAEPGKRIPGMWATRPENVVEGDHHGNRVAEEGVTRCGCGCKYWENDRCIDCGAQAVTA